MFSVSNSSKQLIKLRNPFTVPAWIFFQGKLITIYKTITQTQCSKVKFWVLFFSIYYFSFISTSSLFSWTLNAVKVQYNKQIKKNSHLRRLQGLFHYSLMKLTCTIRLKRRFWDINHIRKQYRLKNVNISIKSLF